MKTIEINGHLREAVGSKSAKQLRREGQVPGVVYGGGSNIHFYADERELNKLVYTPDVFKITLNLDGQKTVAVLREAQYHPVSDKMLHIDLVQVVDGSPVTIQLPVALTGNSVGVKNGGVLRKNAKKLLVKGMIDDLPETISIDITKMKIGSVKKVGELSFPGVQFLETDNRVVVAIKTSRKAVASAGDDEEEGEETAEGAETAAE
jgi:large subunit ribosomal protein L25